MKKLVQFSNFKYNKFNPSLNEWLNSTYSFNKKHYSFILNDNITYLLNTYFNMKLKKSFKEEKAFNLNRIYISQPEVKFSINNINIFVYIFNKEKFVLLKKIKKIKTNKKTINSYFSNKFVITNTFDPNILIINNYNLGFLTKLLYNKLYKLYLYKLYINKLYINKYKFNNFNILSLRNILNKLYNKNVYISIINIKYLYLNNSLFMNAIVRKLKDRNRKALVMLRKAFALVNIPKVNSIFLLKIKKNITFYANTLSSYNKLINKKLIKLSIFESLKNTHMIGIRLIGKGRLTRRLTASRALLKRTYVGNLKNIYSTFRGLSVTTSKGFEKSNIDYVNGNSHNRNGSFGIRSWQNTL